MYKLGKGVGIPEQSGCTPLPSQTQSFKIEVRELSAPTPLKPGLNFDASPDGLWIDLGSILAAQMGPKEDQDTPSDVYQSQSKKNKTLASFVFTLSTLRRCNLTVKTQVFLNIFTLSLLSVLLIILTRGDFKKTFKIGFQRVPKPFQNALRYHMRLGNAPEISLERF